MKTSPLTSYFKFSKLQRAGLLGLFALIVIAQLVYFFADFSSPPETKTKQQWVALPEVKDSAGLQHRKQAYVMRPFNPNFISDFKGYKLGMSVAEIDRLFVYRKSGRYVNSAEEFQQITQVSDSLLKAISPYFKFPDWVKQRQNRSESFVRSSVKKQARPMKDINLASAEELKKVYGIGDGLSARILKEKEKFGGFVSMEQMHDIWGLSDEVIENLNREFNVENLPNVRKININHSGIKELMTLPYFKYPIAKSIVTYRSMNNGIQSVEDLAKISNFPVDKIKIIALYLEF